jgi:hypothetical protein
VGTLGLDLIRRAVEDASDDRLVLAGEVDLHSRPFAEGGDFMKLYLHGTHRGGQHRKVVSVGKARNLAIANVEAMVAGINPAKKGLQAQDKD